jgi:hypothetical protein
MKAVDYKSYFGGKSTIRNMTGMPFLEAGEKKVLLFVEVSPSCNPAYNGAPQAGITTNVFEKSAAKNCLMNFRINFSKANAGEL